MTSKSKRLIIVAVAVAVIAVGWFAFVWFAEPAMTKLPLHPTQAVIQKEAAELKSAVDSLETQAKEATNRLIREALSDDYLSVQEERDVLARSLQEVEDIKTRASSPALVEGFTFSQENGEKLTVAGFSFSDQKAQEIIETEFSRKTTAVKERELVELLRDMLKQNTQGDRWLDNEERDYLVRVLTTPRTGKKAGLNRAVAASTIESFCKANGIQTGQKPG